MTQFKFRLETLLKLREQHRDQCRGALQEAEKAESILVQQAEQLAAEGESMGAEASSAAAPGEINVDQLMDFRRYGMVLAAQLAQLAEQRKVVANEVARRRELLTEADREVKVLEKLKQRQADEFRRKEHYAEVKTLDEIAGQTIQRGRASRQVAKS